MANIIPENFPIAFATSFEMAEDIYISVNFKTQSGYNEYLTFCDDLKLKSLTSSLLNDEDKLKLFIVTQLLKSHSLDRFIKNNSDLSNLFTPDISNSKALCNSESLSFKGGIEDKPMTGETDLVYHFLMNFGSCMKWTQNSNVARILSLCVSDIKEKRCKNKITDLITTRYIGHINWHKLKDEIKSKFDTSIRMRRAKNSDIWNVYIYLLETIFNCDIKRIIQLRKPIKEGKWDEESLLLLLDDINREYGIEVKAWQIKGMMHETFSNERLYETLTEILRSKLQVYPIFVE